MIQILPYLFFLACPISMGVMMWMMMRKDHPVTAKGDPRIADLESQVNELRMTLYDRSGGEVGAMIPTTTPAED